jgi:hypothetical protein
MTILRAFIVNSVTFYSYEKAIDALKVYDPQWIKEEEKRIIDKIRRE